jgi:hypothetical protein
MPEHRALRVAGAGDCGRAPRASHALAVSQPEAAVRLILEASAAAVAA